MYMYMYTANRINFGKPKHIVKKESIGKSVTMITLINLNALDWPKNVPMVLMCLCVDMLCAIIFAICCIYIYMYVYVYVYVYMYMHVYVYMYICIYVYMYICTVYVCMYMYICIYTCLCICIWDPTARESFWVYKLNTFLPYGLNLRDF